MFKIKLLQLILSMPKPNRHKQLQYKKIKVSTPRENKKSNHPAKLMDPICSDSD